MQVGSPQPLCDYGLLLLDIWTLIWKNCQWLRAWDPSLKKSHYLVKGIEEDENQVYCPRSVASRKAESSWSSKACNSQCQVVRELLQPPSRLRQGRGGRPAHFNEEKVYHCLINHVEWFAWQDDKGPQDCCDLAQCKRTYLSCGTFGLTSGVFDFRPMMGILQMRDLHPRTRFLDMPMSRVLKVANKDNLRPWTGLDMQENQASCLWNPQSDPVKNRSAVQLIIHEGRNLG